MSYFAENFTAIAFDVIAMFVMSIATYIVAQLKDAFKAKVAIAKASSKNAMLYEAIDKIVMAMEEEFSESGRGAEKLEAAMGHLSKYCKDKNISLGSKELQLLIKSAVYGMRNGLNA